MYATICADELTVPAGTDELTIAKILVSNELLSALYSLPLNVCNKPTDVDILAVNVFVDCVQLERARRR